MSSTQVCGKSAQKRKTQHFILFVEISCHKKPSADVFLLHNRMQEDPFAFLETSPVTYLLPASAICIMSSLA